ncbi:BTAD domain-containing putative transcriptional regulator [Actinosynnema sp. NPDC004786]
MRGVLAATVLAALLAGPPWALTHFVGRPLPHHPPSWAEVQGVLLGPMTPTFLLDFLACLTWLVWAMFALDVARCAIDVVRDARMPDLSAAGPVHRIAAALVGAVLIFLLGQRADLPVAPASSAGSVGADVVAAASAWNPAPERSAVQVRPVVYTAPHRAAPGVAAERPARAKSAVVLAYNPRTGVYDSLWRMAQRTLGDGNRWPEIYELNKGKPQPGGGTFTRPSLVFPGEEMALPDDATVPATRPAQPPPQLVPAPPTTATPPPDSPPHSTTQPPATIRTPQPTQAPGTQAPNAGAPDDPAFSWGTELFVGLGLASAVSAALVAARRHNRRRYRPGSGERSDLPVAPVVYRLRLAHLRTDHEDLEPDLDGDDEPDLDRPGERPRRAPEPRVVPGADDNVLDDRTAVLPVGVRDGREIALDLAAARGLGLLGAGATTAVRALLVTALATREGQARVVVPAGDLEALLARSPARAPLPTSLHVTDDLDAALDVLEAETLVRLGQHRSTGRSRGPVVLVARAPERQSRRLQAVLDNGSTVGVTGLLLGQWSTGVTAYVRDDGTISTTNPGLGEPLRGAHVFRLGDDHLADLLDLLRHADPGDEPELTGTALDDQRPAGVARPRVVVDAPGPVTAEPPDTVADHGASPDDRRPAGSENTRAGSTVQAPVADSDLEVRAASSDDGRRSDGELEILRPEPAPATSLDPRLRPVQPVPSDDDPATQDAGEAHRHGLSAGNESQGPAESRKASSAPLRVSVLGPPRMWWRPASATPDGETFKMAEREITSAFQPRLRELLVFLALHPDGATREALIAALWATSPPERTTNAMNTALSRLRRSLAAATSNALSDLVVVGEGRYRLDAGLVRVDYHHFAAAVAARRSAVTDTDRVAAYRRIVDSYTGPLADGLSTDWIETAREAIRRDAIDAVAALARALVKDDPQQTLDLLEIARAFDPHNELIYRDIMRLQERLGQLDAIPRTLTLLTTRLAEVDDRPTHQAVDLADRLRRRHDAPGEPGRADRGHSRSG